MNRYLIIGLIIVGVSWSSAAKSTFAAPSNKTAEREPADSRETATRKTTSSQEVDAAFKKWKATLSPDQQKWESTLEACLGGFYLPLYKKEKVAGRKTAWDYVEDDPKLPRVLIIGDSVSRGYTESVRTALAGKANVHRAPTNCGPTTSGIKSLDIWLGNEQWDVITFNFGIHDRASAPDAYGKRLAMIVSRLQKTRAKLIWVSTTPLPATSIYGPDAAIVRLNQAAAQLMKKSRISIADLYSAVHPHLGKYQNPNDCHFNAEGYTFLGETVAKSIEAVLPRKVEKAGGNSPLAAQLTANKTVYELQENPRGKVFRQKLKRQDADKPDPPAIDLTLQLTNTSNRPVTFMLGSDQSKIDLTLEGPGAVTTDSGRAMTMEFRMGRPVTLAPGAKHEFPIKALRWGIRDIGTFGYWTEPGEYTIGASYTWVRAGGETTHTAVAEAVKVTVRTK